MAQPFSVVALNAQTDRSRFDCGVAPLNTYLATQVTQDIKRRVTACFMALNANKELAGFYTLASASIYVADLPDKLAKKLPRYPSIPAVRMGRLAVDLAYRGQGLGAALLADALRRAAKADIAAYALVVDAKDEEAAQFYKHHGFMAMGDAPLCLFLPLASVKNA